jgi:hypothetical protein
MESVVDDTGGTNGLAPRRDPAVATKTDREADGKTNEIAKNISVLY